MFDLVPHADCPSRCVENVRATITRNGGGGLCLEYVVLGAAMLLVPPAAKPARADGLWRTTCFELFSKPDKGSAYCELNLSPSSQWAAYSFSGYRAGMAPLALREPAKIAFSHRATWFKLLAELWPGDLTAGAGRFGLSAVIEETDGTKSYWALAHAPGPPDFHNPACFTATLPPPARS